MTSIIEIKPEQSGARSADVSTYLRSGSISLSTLPPLALYVHYPWCVRKCPYCDFNSHEASPAGAPEDDYLKALRADLEAALPLVWGRSIISVFIGGGTPSLMSAQAVDRLLSDVRALLPLALDCEITLEANRGHSRERFASYRASWVNRLSIESIVDEEKAQSLAESRSRAAFAATHRAAQSITSTGLSMRFRTIVADCRATSSRLAVAAASIAVSLTLSRTASPNTARSTR